MISILKDQLLKLNDKTILELGAGYHESFRETVASKNDYTISDLVLQELPQRLHSRLRVIKADACATGLKDASYDVICSSMLIMYLPIRAHINEVRRLLKKDGFYWAAVTGQWHNIELKELGFDPSIDINKDEMLDYGFTVKNEEQRFEKFKSREQAIDYFKKIGFSYMNPTCIPNGLTKHFLLLELNP